MRATGNLLRMRVVATLFALFGVAFAGVASAQLKTTQPPLKHVTIDIGDKAAVRTGALYFMHQCLACHSLQGMRFNELAAPTGLTEKEVQQFLVISNRRPLQTIVSPMPEALAKGYFGVVPPDLTDEIHLQGADWLYTYLTSFYVDPSRPTGANNVAFHNVAMPDVFAGMQGLQAPIRRPGFRLGKPTPIAVGVKPLTQGSMTPAQFDAMAKDLVTFLAWAGDPHQQQRQAIGIWVIIVTGIWTILAYVMYRLFWRDVVRPHGPRWWSYWKR